MKPQPQSSWWDNLAGVNNNSKRTRRSTVAGAITSRPVLSSEDSELLELNATQPHTRCHCTPQYSQPWLDSVSCQRTNSKQQTTILTVPHMLCFERPERVSIKSIKAAKQYNKTTKSQQAGAGCQVAVAAVSPACRCSCGGTAVLQQHGCVDNHSRWGGQRVVAAGAVGW